jgi:phage terminase small subunit
MTPKQLRFIEAYTIEPNATKAALRAGYGKKNAKQQGTQNLALPIIRAELDKAEAARKVLVKEELARLDCTVVNVLKELATIGFADMSQFLKLGEGETTVKLDWSNLPEGATKCIQEITQEEHTGGRGHDTGQIKRTKFKLYSKLDALEKIGRHLSMFTEKIKIEGSFLDALSPDELVDLVQKLKTAGYGREQAAPHLTVVPKEA